RRTAAGGRVGAAGPGLWLLRPGAFHQRLPGPHWPQPDGLSRAAGKAPKPCPARRVRSIFSNTHAPSPLEWPPTRPSAAARLANSLGPARYQGVCAMAVNPTPAGYPPVSPSLIVRGAARAIEFYENVFGATEFMRFADPSGKVGHAEIKIGNSPIMLAD